MDPLLDTLAREHSAFVKAQSDLYPEKQFRVVLLINSTTLDFIKSAVNGTDFQVKAAYTDEFEANCDFWYPFPYPYGSVGMAGVPIRLAFMLDFEYQFEIEFGNYGKQNPLTDTEEETNDD